MSEMQSEMDAVEELPNENRVVTVEDPEAPEADAAEQHTELRDAEEPLPSPGAADVDEADAFEQSRVVDLDEDEYR